MKELSSELFARAQQVAPGGVHSPVRSFKSVGGTPIFFSEASGPYLTSVEGAQYVDLCQSFGPLILGHRDPDVAAAVERMFNKAWTFGACEPYSLELAEWIVDQVKHVDRVRFVSSGTEAVMSALRVARGATKRNKIVKFEGCYHGHVDSLLVKAGSGLAGTAASDSAGVSKVLASETIVLPLGDSAAVEAAFRKYPDQIAAVIVEPLPANFGLLKQDPKFLHDLRAITEKEKALLIFDEVISGFRVAIGGMAELLGIEPDLVTYGKVIGGGFPVGCYAGKKQYMDLVAPSGPVYQAGTLSGNPIGMVAGLATLRKMQKHNVIAELNHRTQYFVEGLESQIKNADLPFKVSHFGSLLWIHGASVADPSSLDQINKDQGDVFKKLFTCCLEEGIYLAPSGYEVGFLSWAHTDKVIVDTLLRFRKAFESFRGSLKQ